MKIFIKTEAAPYSINLVDTRNRVVGWSAQQQCCENHSARIVQTMPTAWENPHGSRVFDRDDMTREEEQRFMNGEKIYRATIDVKVEDMVIDLGMLENATLDLPDWEIDPDFFVRPCCSTAVFRLESAEGSEMFLVLENHHNGYYSHGFSLSVGGIKKFGGEL
jgi:hypothetical protein